MAHNPDNEPAAEADSLIRSGDIQVSTWTARSTGLARLVPNGIRVLHTPTGLVVECEDDRSQHRNRQIALERLEAKLKELGWTPGAVADEPQDMTSRLSRALADELRRRRVTSLALKGELMRDLGLDTLEQAAAWMTQASLTFAAVAEEFIASQPAARVEDGAWRSSVERLVRAKDRVDETRLAIQGEDADTSPAAEQRHTAALILLEGEFRRARELVAPLPCSVVDSDVEEGAGLADSQPLNVNLHALAKNPAAALRAFGPEWVGRCAVSALQALAAHEVLIPLNPVDLRGVDVGSPTDWSQIPNAQSTQLVQVADVPRLVARLLGTRRYASQDLMGYPYHQVEGRYEAPGRPGVTVSLDLRARNVGTEAQIEISITDHYSRSNRSSTSHFGLQLPTAAARALALAICPDLAVDHVAASYREEPSSGA